MGILLFLSFHSFCFSQNLDLIVTAKGDSIATKIDSISDSKIYFDVKYKGKWVNTTMLLDEVTDYKRGVINRKDVFFEPGSSYILPQNNYELNKALKLQKTGRIFNIVGASFFGLLVGAVIMENVADTDPWATIGIGIISVPAGVASLAIGIPMNITGKKRVARINVAKNTANDGIRIDINPCTQYNYLTQDYQPGVSLRFRF